MWKTIFYWILLAPYCACRLISFLPSSFCFFSEMFLSETSTSSLSIIYVEIPFLNEVTILSVQFSSVAQSCPTLCNPMNRSMPGLPVHHQVPEFTQTHVHQVRDAIQQSHPLLSPSPPALNPSQHQSLLQWVNSSHEVDNYIGHIKFAFFPPGLWFCIEQTYYWALTLGRVFICSRNYISHPTNSLLSIYYV